MGKPFKSADDAGVQTIVQTIMNEVVSAMSALNMHPEPKECPPGGNGYLSETDAWAEHCMEHLRNVLVELRKLEVETGKIGDIAYRGVKNKTVSETIFGHLMDLLHGKDKSS
jgi:hypothetical protein